MKRTFKKLYFYCVIFMVWFILHSIYIIFDGLNDKGNQANVAVVLGNKVNKDGTLSIRLKERLSKSLELYNNNRIKKIIVSGGFGKEGFWEADKMKEYLVSNKIPSEAIIVDNYGDNTEKTVINSLRIIDSLNFNSAISVSQFFHQSRIKMLFHKKGFKNIDSASPNYFELRDFYAIFREFPAYYLQAF